MAKLFGTSGMRGLANMDITPQLALLVGQALTNFTKAEEILIARDTRTTSYMLEAAIAAGVAACGATVLQQGVVPTPVLAYLTKKTKAKAGVMVTASHNPPEYNGVKLYNPDTSAYSDYQQSQIEGMITKKEFQLATWQDVGKAVALDETEQYIELITRNVRLQKPWKIVVDPGNGATSQLAPAIFEKLGLEVVSINSHPDGSFPGRGAEPNEESLSLLCNLVKKLNADLGIAFDGDGDRMIVIDEKGRVSPLDQTFAAYAAHVIRKQKNKTVITHVEASMCVDKMIEANGGRVVKTRVGDIYITEGIKQNNASFGGEPCGAWIHPDYHYCPDGILSSALLLKALEEENSTLTSLVSKAPQYPLLRRKVPCPNSLKPILMEKAEETLPRIFSDLSEKSNVDGLRLALKQGWVLIRPSGTEPLIRITAEAETRKAAEGNMKKTANLINKLVKEANY